MKIDPETLAGLMDGRLSDEERTEVLAALGDSEADLEVLGDAAAALSEVEKESALTTDSPPSSRPSGIAWKRWLPLAAVVAGLTAIPFIRDSDDLSLTGLRMELATVGPLASPLSLPPAAGGDPVRSGVTGAAAESLSPMARSFWRGSAFARLSVVESGSRITSSEAASLDALLTSSAGGAARLAVQDWYEGDAGDDAAWTSAADALAGVEGERAAFQLGLLVETASLLSAEGGSASAVALLEADLAAVFDQLDEGVRVAVAGEFARLNTALGRGDPGSALHAFAQRIGTLGSPDSPLP